MQFGMLFRTLAGRSIAHGNGSSRVFRASLLHLQCPKVETPSKYDALVPAVREYYAEFGHFVIPRTYKTQVKTTNADGSIQERTWLAGVTLEAFLSNPHCRQKHPHVLRELDAVGFPVHVNYAQFLWEHYHLEALRCYKQLHGDLLIPNRFTVPSNAPEWPRVCWTMKLGCVVRNLRNRRATVPAWKIESLNAMEFVWNVLDHQWNEHIMPALRHFHQLHGHTMVPHWFTVPTNDKVWPKQLGGLRLGSLVNNIRTKTYHKDYVEAHAAEFEQLGFVFNVYDFRWSEYILPSLQVFYKVHGHSKVPWNFIVPSMEPWPAKTHGMKLGCIVSTIKRVGSFAPQRQRDQQQLASIGFLSDIVIS